MRRHSCHRTLACQNLGHAPGLPKLTYYECPSCGKVRVNSFYCVDCRSIMLLKIPSKVGGYPFADLAHSGPVRYERCVTLNG